MAITFEFRKMTDVEFKREKSAFDEHGLEFDNPPEKQERFGFVATDDGKFVGSNILDIEKMGGFMYETEK